MATQKTHIVDHHIARERHLVVAETNTDGTATIRFGTSLTLRLDEHNVDRLRQLLHDVGCHLMNDSTASTSKPIWTALREGKPSSPTAEVNDTLKAWADEKEQLQHLLDLAQCSEV